MMIRNANIYDHNTRSFRLLDLRIDGDRIAEMGEHLSGTDGEDVDLGGRAVVPGLLDVHTHGCMGHDFVSCTSQDLSKMAAFYASHGVTTVMPTLASAPLDDMYEAVARMAAFVPKKDEADLFGVHLEGRYLNAAKKGAHALHLLSALEKKELEHEVFRMCRALHISAAYELDEDGSFAEAALAIGATLGLGHTAATYEQARKAEARGVSAYTHLYNCMPPLHHRDGGAIAAAFEGKALAEVICDGVHISPEMIRLAARNLTAGRLVLISDSMEATGGADGEYSIAGNPVIVKNGKALTLEGALAGSTLTVDTAVNNLMDFTGLPLCEAILCATVNPAREIGVFDEVGSIEVGKRADLLVLGSTERLDVERVMLRGTWRA